MKNHYHSLGIETDSSPAQIRAAYTERLAGYAGDERSSEAALYFADVQEAYEVLSHPDRRAAYDSKLTANRQVHQQERRRIRQYHSSAKGVNAGLTLVLIVLIMLFGYYVFKAFKSIKGTKAAPPASAVLAANPAPANVKHARKFRQTLYKGRALIAAKKFSVRHKPTVRQPVTAAHASTPPGPVIAAVLVKTLPAKTLPVPSLPVQEPPAPVMEDRPAMHDDSKVTPAFLYETRLIANQTGIIRLRDAASYNAEVLASLPTNSRAEVLERGNLYYRVKVNNTIGYVPRWTVQDK